MGEEMKIKPLLLSIISFIKTIDIVKDRASNFKGDKVSFFDTLKRESLYLNDLWSKYFPSSDIASFDRFFSKYEIVANEIFFGMNKGENKSQNINTHLSHLLSKVTLKNKGGDIRTHLFKEFEHNTIFPAEKIDSIDNIIKYYEKSYNEISKGIVKICKQASIDNNLFAMTSALDSLFFKYLFNVPAYLQDGNESVDVSLYEYAKMTASIISICYEQDINGSFDVDNNFLLIRGDFFSIQNFIFDKNMSNKNPAKLLRGKSFYVNLLSDIACIYILEELGLSYFNIMMNAAGQFVIISPNDIEIREKLKVIKQNITDYLYNEYYASVCLAISEKECSKDDFQKERFSNLILEMLDMKERAKLKKFDLSKRSDFVYSSYLEKFKDTSEICSFCGVEPITIKKDDVRYCSKCEKYIELGDKLIKASHINIYHNDNGIFNKYSYAFDEERIESAIYRMNIDFGSHKDYKYNSCNVIHYKNYAVRSKYDEVMPFDEIVKVGNGAEILGVLKADVDNLGLVFACGLSKKDENGDVVIDRNETFSKTNMLSRNIHNFFSLYLYHLMKENKYNIYTVFAGGDDLFLVGKYSDIVGFAVILNREFKKVAGYNHDISISAGIGLFKNNVPIWYMAEMTEDLLEKSKNYRVNDDVNSIDKGNISILYTTCKYDDFVNSFDEFQLKMKDIDNRGVDISRGIYYKIMEFCDMEQELINSKNNSGKFNINNALWRSRLCYTISKSSLENSIKSDILQYFTDNISKNPSLLKTLLALKIYDTRNIEKGE